MQYHRTLDIYSNTVMDDLRRHRDSTIFKFALKEVFKNNTEEEIFKLSLISIAINLYVESIKLHKDDLSSLDRYDKLSKYIDEYMDDITVVGFYHTLSKRKNIIGFTLKMCFESNRNIHYSYTFRSNLNKIEQPTCFEVLGDLNMYKVI